MWVCKCCLENETRGSSAVSFRIRRRRGRIDPRYNGSQLGAIAHVPTHFSTHSPRPCEAGDDPQDSAEQGSGVPISAVEEERADDRAEHQADRREQVEGSGSLDDAGFEKGELDFVTYPGVQGVRYRQQHVFDLPAECLTDSFGVAGMTCLCPPYANGEAAGVINRRDPSVFDTSVTHGNTLAGSGRGTSQVTPASSNRRSISSISFSMSSRV